MPNVMRSVVMSLALKGVALLFMISTQPVLALDIFLYTVITINIPG